MDSKCISNQFCRIVGAFCLKRHRISSELDRDRFERRQQMPKTQTDENPILQRRAKLIVTLPEGLPERGGPFELRNLACERAVLQLVITRRCHSGFDIRGQRNCHGVKVTRAALQSKRAA
jgi:hypothetical protein